MRAYAWRNRSALLAWIQRTDTSGCVSRSQNTYASAICVFLVLISILDGKRERLPLPNAAQAVETRSRLRCTARRRLPMPVPELALQLFEDLGTPNEVWIIGVWHENYSP